MFWNSIQSCMTFIIKSVEAFGYFGMFFMTFIESTFIPLPSEITLIPAGYLLFQGQIQLIPAMFASLSGTLLGSLLNYVIAYKYGRKLFINHSKYFFLKKGQLLKLELYFSKYGNISTFFGRMLPGIKHFISFPAGLAKMNLKLFCFYTLAGSFFWLSTLLYLGYMIGINEELINQYVKKIHYVVFACCVISILFFCIKTRKLS